MTYAVNTLEVASVFNRSDREFATMRVVLTTIQATRQHHGLRLLCHDARLSQAAQTYSTTVASIDDPDAVEVVTEYRRRAIEAGYPGAQVVGAFHKNVWPRDVSNSDIAREILHLSTIAQQDYWEDWGVGVTPISDPESPDEWGFCVFLGFGYTDGSGLVINQINAERKKAGVAPLELHPGIRASGSWREAMCH